MTGNKIMNNDNLSFQKKLDAFEKQYHHVRLTEQRIYSNDQIARLPEIESDHVHYAEWNIRKKSSEQLIESLKKKKSKLNILEVGCGNGWLAAKFADIENSTVTGIDVNRIELMQAVTTFEKKDNLHFIYGDIRTLTFKPNSFDVIVFAASIQYFSSLVAIITKALSLLTNDGEIHIIDSPFYSKQEVDLAANRTKEYYNALGFEEMSSYYFHHCINDLKQFNHEIIYNPKSIINRLRKMHQPFYRIIIKQKK
jgi:ubiquinone/menaquinone biosynthesis C-methylase UbiE